MSFNRTLHPFLSLFSYHDYKLGRMVRFILVLGQISLITILIWVAFGKTGEDLFGNEISERMLLVSIILSFITLPLPRGILKCFETRLYVFKDEADIEKKSKENSDKTKYIDNSRLASDINLDVDQGGETDTELPEEKRVTYF